MDGSQNAPPGPSSIDLAPAALVIACDKLHNLRCQVADLEATGQTIKFNAPSSRVWVHLRTMEILGHHLPHGLKQALESTQRKWLILLM
jgi:hypothetical protein